MDGESLDDDTLMPTIILHDIGWSDCPSELIRNFFKSVKDADTQKELRTAHMKAGARLSRQVLKNLGWDAGKIDLIASIIAKHDDSDAMTTPEEKLIFDADYSWRFSPAGFYLDLERFVHDADFTLESAIRRLEEAMSKLKTETGRRIAERELNARRAEIIVR
jgi:hypothetical protein